MRQRLFLTVAAVVLLGVPAVGSAQQQNSQIQPAQQGQASQLSQQDRQFVEKAAVGNQFEVEAGQLANEKVQGQPMKQFAQRMVDDHRKAGDQLKSIVQGKGVQVPQQLDSEHQQMLDRLRGLSGGEFEQAYVQGQVDAHQKTIDLYKRQAQQGQDADLKRFAQDTLPVLNEHLRFAQDLRPATASAGGQGQQSQGQQPSALTSVDNLIGRDVYGRDGQELGEISDVILDAQSRRAMAIVIGSGGFLGIGEKNIMLHMNTLDIQGDRVVANQITQEQVRQMPSFEYDQNTVSINPDNNRNQNTDRDRNKTQQ